MMMFDVKFILSINMFRSSEAFLCVELYFHMNSANGPIEDFYTFSFSLFSPQDLIAKGNESQAESETTKEGRRSLKKLSGERP